MVTSWVESRIGGWGRVKETLGFYCTLVLFE